MTYNFSASRMTGGNAIFPDKLEIDDERVTFYKARLMGYSTTVIQRSSIGNPLAELNRGEKQRKNR